MKIENKIKVAVLVSGGGTNLQALIDAQKEGIIKHGEISLVISNNPGAYAITRAENANIPTAIISSKEYETQEVFEKKLIDILEENNKANLKSEISLSTSPFSKVLNFYSLK